MQHHICDIFHSFLTVNRDTVVHIINANRTQAAFQQTHGGQTADDLFQQLIAVEVQDAGIVAIGGGAVIGAVGAGIDQVDIIGRTGNILLGHVAGGSGILGSILLTGNRVLTVSIKGIAGILTGVVTDHPAVIADGRRVGAAGSAVSPAAVAGSEQHTEALVVTGGPVTGIAIGLGSGRGGNLGLAVHVVDSSAAEGSSLGGVAEVGNISQVKALTGIHLGQIQTGTANTGDVAHHGVLVADGAVQRDHRVLPASVSIEALLVDLIGGSPVGAIRHQTGIFPSADGFLVVIGRGFIITLRPQAEVIIGIQAVGTVHQHHVIHSADGRNPQALGDSRGVRSILTELRQQNLIVAIGGQAHIHCTITFRLLLHPDGVHIKGIGTGLIGIAVRIEIGLGRAIGPGPIRVGRITVGEITFRLGGGGKVHTVVNLGGLTVTHDGVGAGGLPVIVQGEQVGSAQVHRGSNGGSGGGKVAGVVAQVLTGVLVECHTGLTIVFGFFQIVKEANMGNVHGAGHTGIGGGDGILVVPGEPDIVDIGAGAVNGFQVKNLIDPIRGILQGRPRSVVLTKAGVTGNRDLEAVGCHTGSLVGDDHVANVACRGLGSIKTADHQVSVGTQTVVADMHIHGGTKVLSLYLLDLIRLAAAICVPLPIGSIVAAGAPGRRRIIGIVRTQSSYRRRFAATVRYSIALSVSITGGHTGTTVLGVVPLEEHTVIQIVIDLDGPVDGILFLQRIDLNTGFDRLQLAKSEHVCRNQLHGHDENQHHSQNSHR